ncbi:hypothetical protein D3C72_1918440 [compost metagenome]
MIVQTTSGTINPNLLSLGIIFKGPRIDNTLRYNLVEARNLIATQCVNSTDFALASHIDALDKPLHYLLNKLIASDSEITKLKDSFIKGVCQ